MTQPVTLIQPSFHHTPMDACRDFFFPVLRANHLLLSPEYHIRNGLYPGHDFLHGISGKGVFEIGGRTFTIEEGDLAWIDYNRHDVKWLSRDAPWEFLGVRIDSKVIDSMASFLNVRENPIFKPNKPIPIRNCFENIFEILKNRSVSMDAKLHIEISTLVAISFESRLSDDGRDEAREAHMTRSVAKVVDAIRAEYGRQWKIKDLAQIMGFSEPQLFRQFKQATGSTPMDWLRRERINYAKRLLTETDDRISLIAERVGYEDPLHFSREFKRITGVSPRNYRHRERM